MNKELEKLIREIRGKSEKNKSSGVRRECSEDYEVGYKKPPKEYQFKPGQSGNSKGRPKINKNPYALIDEAIEEVNREYEEKESREKCREKNH